MYRLQRDRQAVRAFPGLPAVDRTLFIPDEIYVNHEIPYESWTEAQRASMRPGEKLLSRWHPLNRQEDPERWARWVAKNDSVVTRVDDHDRATSSSSAPEVMARMIEVLDLKPGMRVLEVGTGTGFNAACLAALGAEVTSIEVQTEVAEQARTGLKRAGYPGVDVITGDGALGAPQSAPFDRVMATAAIRTVPYAWVRQTRDGGKIVTPYTGEGANGALLVLRVSAGVAEGRTADVPVTFMPLTGHRLTPAERNAIDNRPGLTVRVGPEGQQVTFE